MKRKITFALAIFLFFTSAGFAQTKGYRNPSAVYCEALGYKYETIKDDKGNAIGVCHLPDGSVVDAWDFYKGKVGKTYSYCAKKGYYTENRVIKNDGYITECAVCTGKDSKGNSVEIPVDQLMEQNGEGMFLFDKTAPKKTDGFGPVDYKLSNPKKDIPNAFDWRNYNGHTYIGPVRNQGSCGSCYSFGANACAEGTYNYATGKYDGNCVDLSESFIIWCLGSIPPWSSHFSGCNGADYDYMELQALCDSGVSYEAAFPYVQSNPGCGTHWNDPRIKMKSWARVPCSDTTAIKNAIMTYGVVDAAVYVAGSFDTYSGGIFTDAQTACNGTPCDYTSTNHAISLVGWGHDPTHGLYWILRNSWGASWGESGYMRIKWNASRVACEVCYMTYSSKPIVATTNATNVLATTATLNGTVNPSGKTTNYYFQWGTTTNYTDSSSIQNAGNGTTNVNVSANITGLTNNTLYHYRLVAINADGRTNGNDITFRTGFPTVTTANASAITTTSATSGGNVISDGGSTVTARGVCWSTSANPTLADNHTTDGSGTGTFTSSITGLSANTTYHTRAYATNSNGTSYGEDITFKTLCGINNIPLVEGFNSADTPSCWSIAIVTSGATQPAITFVSSGTYPTVSPQEGTHMVKFNSFNATTNSEIRMVTPPINSVGYSAVSLDFYWNESTGYSSNQDKVIIQYSTDGTTWTNVAEYLRYNATPGWKNKICNLPAGAAGQSTLYVGFLFKSAYGENCYLDNLQITGIAAGAPTVTTTAASSITQTTAIAGGNVTNDGGNPVTARGICWSTSANPTIADNHTTDGSGTGTFTSNLTGLSPATTYHIRAYATNSIATVYGDDLTFTTQCGIINTFPYIEDFEASATLPNCWTQEYVNGTINWQIGKGNGASNPSTAHSGVRNTYFKVTASADRGKTTRLIMPTLDFTTLTNPKLKFWHTQAYWNPDQDTLRIYYKNSSGGSWTLLQTYSNSITTWQQDSINLPNPSNDYYIAFVGKAQYGYGICIDDVQITGIVAALPTVSTTAATSITQTTATTGGNVTNDGGSPVTARGICWSTSPNPTISGNHTTDGTGTGTFTSSLTGLTANTLYYIRAYATNGNGTAYGNELTFTTLPNPVLASVTTTPASNIDTASATSGGNVTNDGGATVTAKGVCWSTSANPTISDAHTTDGSGTGTFTSSITGLTPSTLYHVRAYATNSVGTAYGNDLTFTTAALPVAPSVTTDPITVFALTTAVAGGNVTSDGGANVTARGVCWSTSTNPTLSDNFTIDGTGTGAFTSNLSGLTANTTYYVRAYATNWVGTTYGNEQSFTTLVSAIAPTVTTNTISNIDTNSATGGGNVISDGGDAVTARGVCWSTSANPTIIDAHTTDGSGTGAFTSSITGLNSSTTYYVRAYATNSVGTSYGAEQTFTTATPPVLATVTTDAASAITQTAATSGGNVTNDGGAAVTARGVCWSTSANPTISDAHTTDGNGTGTFTSSLTGLTASTTYYVRAYATNSVGTAYGNQITFTTLANPVLATVTTDAASAITQTTATSGGNVTNDGGAAVTARGVCWSTSVNPTISDAHTTDGSGTGTFTSSLTGLTASTTYYVRAYATNSVGTAYGNQITFTTSSNLVLATVTTNTASAIAQTTATSGGNVTNDGGATVTARGVCWSTSANPTISDAHTTDGNGTGTFTSSLTGLTASTTYYVRAYATNSVGTAYGNQITFTTLANPVLATVTTNAITNIDTTSASGGGNVTNDGGATVTARGVCWSTSANPTISDAHTTNGTGTGIFTSSLSGLTPNTTYYVRAYATNSVGTAYGNQVNFTTQNIGLQNISAQEIAIFPNPTNGELHIKFDRLIKSGQIEIINIEGQLIETISIQNSSKIDINLANQPKGIYTINIKLEDKVVQSKLVIQ